MEMKTCKGLKLTASSSGVTVTWSPDAFLADYPWLHVWLLKGGANSATLEKTLYKQHFSNSDRMVISSKNASGGAAGLRKQWFLVYCAKSPQADVSELKERLRNQELRKYISAVVIGPSVQVKYSIKEKRSAKVSVLKQVEIETDSSAAIDRLLYYGYRLGGQLIRYEFPETVPQGRKTWPKVLIPTEAELDLFADEAAKSKITVERRDQQGLFGFFGRVFNR